MTEIHCEFLLFAHCTELKEAKLGGNPYTDPELRKLADAGNWADVAKYLKSAPQDRATLAPAGPASPAANPPASTSVPAPAEPKPKEEDMADEGVALDDVVSLQVCLLAYHQVSGWMLCFLRCSRLR